MGRGHSWAELLGQRDAFGEPFAKPEAPSLTEALGELSKFFGRDRSGVPRGGPRFGPVRAPGDARSDRPRRSCCRGKR